MRYGSTTLKSAVKYRTETDVTERFLTDMCVFGPKYSVTRKGLFEAWEKWALNEGEEPGKQNSFTRLISERSKSLKVEDGRNQKGDRAWVGIGLKSDKTFGSDDKVTRPESPANQQKIEDSCHFSENSTEVQSLPPSYSTSGKIPEKVTNSQKVSDEPQTFDFGDITATYHGKGE